MVDPGLSDRLAEAGLHENVPQKAGLSPLPDLSHRGSRDVILAVELPLPIGGMTGPEVVVDSVGENNDVVRQLLRLGPHNGPLEAPRGKSAMRNLRHVTVHALELAGE